MSASAQRTAVDLSNSDARIRAAEARAHSEEKRANDAEAALAASQRQLAEAEARAVNSDSARARADGHILGLEKQLEELKRSQEYVAVIGIVSLTHQHRLEAG
jgi:hypothetical protein